MFQNATNLYVLHFKKIYLVKHFWRNLFKTKVDIYKKKVKEIRIWRVDSFAI